MKAIEIARLVMKVLDAPKTYRLVIDTGLPSLNTKGWIVNDLEEKSGLNVDETISYLIDRSSDEGKTVSDKWLVSTSCGTFDEIPTNELLIKFIETITESCPNADIHIEIY